MKKIVFLMLVFCVVGMVGCGKDDGGENGGNGGTSVTPAQPSTPKVYTFVYDDDGIPADTARAYLDVDTFYVVPLQWDYFATLPSEGFHNLRNHLQSIIDINSKTRGKGDFRAKYASVEDSAWLSQFGYNVSR